MRHLSFATATLCLLLAVSRTTRADMIYDIQNYPSDQQGHTVTGTITTDGIIGPLTEADIKSWTVTFDQGTRDAYTFSSTPLNAEVFVAGVQATPTNMTMSAPTSASSETRLSLEVVGGEAPSNDLQWARYLSSPTGEQLNLEGSYSAHGKNGDRLWYTGNPQVGGTDPWVLAVAPASAIPEPASLWLLGTASPRAWPTVGPAAGLRGSRGFCGWASRRGC